MLQVDLRELVQGPVETRAELARDDPLLEGVTVALSEPVRVAGRLQATGNGRFYWRGSLRTQLAGECRRCLVPVPVAGHADINALFSQDPDAQEDPDSYPLQPDATQIDLRRPPRQEPLLALPQSAVSPADR